MSTPTVVADVTENFVVTKLAQSNLDPVAMSSEILEGMETLSKKPVSFPKLGSLPTSGIATFLNTFAERAANERSGCIPTTVFGGHIVLSAAYQPLCRHHGAQYRPSYPCGSLSPTHVS